MSAYTKRNILRRCLFGLVYSLCCWTPLSAFGTNISIVPEKVKELEDDILARRRAIKSGQIRVSRIWKSTLPPGDRQDVITTWFDGPLVREDLRQGSVTTTRCYGADRFYTYSDQKFADGGGYVMQVRDLQHADRAQWYVHQPTMLMLHPLWFRAAGRFHMESYIRTPSRSNFSAEQTPLDGVDTWKVSYDIVQKVPSRVTYWVVPSQGFSIVRMEQSYSGPDGMAYRDMVRATVKQASAGIWFPVSVVYERTENNRLMIQEDLTVELISANEGMDPSVFQPETMNVPAGTTVVRVPPDPRGNLIWDGKRIVVETARDRLARLSEATKWSAHGSDRLRRAVFLGLSALLAVIGALLYWRRRARANVGISPP